MRRSILPALLLVLAIAPGAPPAAAQETRRAPGLVGDWLPDSTVLARVNDRVIRAGTFVDRYFASDGRFRPAPDSAGRAEFLETMIQKEILASIARGIDRPLSFEDRVTLRAATNTALAATLQQRAVRDSATVTDEELRRYHPQYGRDLHLRQIHFASREIAEKVRADLVRGRIKWTDAVRRYAVTDRGPEGDLGWVTRVQMGGEPALVVFDLAPGAISPVVRDHTGSFVVQVVAERKVSMPAYSSVRRALANDLRAAKSQPHLDRLFGALRARHGVVYDTTQIAWLAGRMAEVATPAEDSTIVVDMRGLLPDIAPEDTSRVLVRGRDRSMSLGSFLANYRTVPPALRRRLTDFWAIVAAIDIFFLEPQLIEEAVARGLDKDPMTVAEVERKREQLMVEHLYQDSILARVSVTPDDRRRFYEERKHEFTAKAQARYAWLIRPTAESADSLIKALDGGANADELVQADRAVGINSLLRTDIQEPNHRFYTLLFEELREGRSARVGPDQEGKYAVIHMIEHLPERQMAFEEVEAMVDESVYNIAAEKRFLDFIARHARRFTIERHPDRLMKVLLSDPTLDQI